MNLSSLVDESLLTEDIIDPRWEDSPFFKLKLMKAKQAGARYERIASNIMENLNHTVEKPLNTDHDRIIDGVKYEIKGSMLTKGSEDKFSFLQIRPDQDYDAVLFMAIDFDTIRLYQLSKEEIQSRIDAGIFKKQHGGNKGNSRTFCYNGTIENLAPHPITE